MDEKLKIAFIGATEEELVKLKHIADKLPDSTYYYVVKSGIGKVNAALAAQWAIDSFSPEYVVSFGLAGGLIPGIRGKLVTPKRVFYWDVWCGEPNSRGQIQGEPLFYECAISPMIDECMQKYFEEFPSLCESVATSDKFAETEDEIKLIKDIDECAVAVDMESAAIAQVCHRAGVKFLAYKVISDIVGSANQLSQYENAKEEYL